MTNMKSSSGSRSYRQVARAQAAEDTGRRIVDAFLARLLAEWYDDITLDRVAADAAVTVQTVVRRFGGKEGLLASAVKVLAAQINAQRASPPGEVVHLVENLVADYERTGDAVIRLLALEPRHQALREALDLGRAEHRRWVSTAFAASLGQVASGPAREGTIDALVVVTDVYTWKLLRRDAHRSAAETGETIRGLIQAVLSQLPQT
jgi:AcrR family transcriptional regulator